MPSGETTYVQLRKLGRAIAAARRELGISQEDFAEVAEVHRTHMGQIERGEVNVSWDSVSKVCRALRVKPSSLMLRAGL